MAAARKEQHALDQRNLVTKLVNRVQEWEGFEMIPASDRTEARRMLDSSGGITLPDGSKAKANVILVFGRDFAQLASELEVRDLSRSGSRRSLWSCATPFG